MADDLALTLSRDRPAAAAGTAPAARLTVVHPRSRGVQIEIGEARCVVGRRPGEVEADVAIALDDPTVSRAHVAITYDRASDRHRATDLGSRNGSHVDGRRITAPLPLDDGAVLRLGDLLMVYERGASGREGSPVSPEALPGCALVLEPLRAALVAAAADHAPVLLLGETGAGKERLAAEVHRLSGRRGPLLALNCSAIPEPLVESQLFGHLRGAFTGATEAQPGLFRAAQGGTLFLDEVGDLPPPLQPKLLRVLQEREVLPVGATRAVPVDVRVVAATHRDLARAADLGEFRADLYARLALWELRVPPLRRRRVDLFTWIDRLAGAGRTPAFDADAAEALLLQPWTLNLRAVDRLTRALAGHPGLVRLGDLPPWLSLPGAPVATAEATPAADAAPLLPPPPTREELTAAYAALQGNVHALARRFGRDRRQIYRWLAAFGLRPPRPR